MVGDSIRGVLRGLRVYQMVQESTRWFDKGFWMNGLRERTRWFDKGFWMNGESVQEDKRHYDTV